MGRGKQVRCKVCGCTQDILTGVGFLNKPVKQKKPLKCPSCGSTEFEETDIVIFWD
jgi:predicted nucleic-acid-binding Zn-ribbon protein